MCPGSNSTKYQGRNRPTVLEVMVDKSTFLLEPALDENPGRCLVGFEHICRQLGKIQIVEGIFRESAQDPGHDPLVPKRSRKPIADFGAMEMTSPVTDQPQCTNQLVPLSDCPVRVETEFLSVGNRQIDP